MSRVKVMGAERREAGAEAERERDILLGSESALLSCTVYCALHSTGGHSWTRGLGSERQRVGQTRDQGCHLSCLQTISVALPPASAVVTQSVT